MKPRTASLDNSLMVIGGDPVVRMLLVLLVFVGLVFASPTSFCASAAPASNTPSSGSGAGITSAAIIAGPFDLHRKYPSMYGPYVIQKCSLSDLIGSKKTLIPESKVIFVEGGPSSTDRTTAPAAEAVSHVRAGNSDSGETKKKSRELYWFRGIKVQVLDEDDKVLPTGEFVCHIAVDVDTEQRSSIFPNSDKSGNGRIIILTQGQTEFTFPEGFGVPVASDESWTFTLQAGNHTTEEHRRVKHLLTLEFVKDSELSQPLKALTWYNPYIAVVVDKGDKSNDKRVDSGSCRCISAAESSPSRAPGSDFKDSLGRRLAQHWVVPPGVHTYQSPVSDERDPGFASKDKLIHAVWTHIHLLCSNASMIQCDGESRKKIFDVHAVTKTDGGLQILKIDDIISKEGIRLAGGHKYEMECTYNNVMDEPEDSMVEFGVFFDDSSFQKPVWALPRSTLSASKDESASGASTCALAPNYPPFNVSTDTKLNVALIPLFDAKTDGPLLSEVKNIEISTTAGNLHIALDPAGAPQHATQMYKLFTRGVLNGSAINRYQPNYYLQTSQAEAKVDGQPLLNDESQDMLRRLPLEVTSSALHKKWSLSMSRFEEPDSAVSSFSIMLADAPHMDGHYTVFGRIIPDDITLSTLSEIEKNWNRHQPWIIDAHEFTSSVAATKNSSLPKSPDKGKAL